MTALDAINGAFEALGSVCMLNHCRVVMRDRGVKGVSVLSTAFFLAWGLWNCYYYPAIGQWGSFVGGVCLAAANVLYVSLLMRFRTGGA